MRDPVMRALLVIVVLLAPTRAFADNAEPWKDGVAAADQARANALFAEANQLFAQQAHAPALEKYKEAIAIWDHPVIRFNMAVALVRLDRMLEAADAIDAALRYGPAPFTAESYAQVLDYQTLVRGRIGEIAASCKQAGATVVLDGKAWFSCPGRQTKRVLSGEHTVSGEHPSLFARPQRITVVGGSVSDIDVELASVDDAFTYERRFPAWVPWTTIAVGGIGLLAGLFFEVDAQNRMNQFAQDVASQCAVKGCELDPPASAPEKPLADRLVEERDAAHARDRLAVITMSVGAGLAVTGIVLTILNRPTRRARVEAHVTASGAAASVGWSF